MRIPSTSASVLIDDLIAASARLQQRFTAHLSNARGISYSEYQLLAALEGFPKSSATRVALAGATQLTPSGVTRALKPLEKLGIVETLKDERDARRSLAQLTKAGKALLADAHHVVADAMRGFPTLPKAERLAFSAFLRELAQA